MPWNMEHANPFLLLSYHQKCDYPIILRVSQTLTPQVRLSAFGGPHDAPCRRFHVPSADPVQHAFRHDAPRRRLVTDIPLARHTAAPARHTSARRATPRLRRATPRPGGTRHMFLCSRSLPLSLYSSLPRCALTLLKKKKKK